MNAMPKVLGMKNGIKRRCTVVYQEGRQGGGGECQIEASSTNIERGTQKT